MKVKIGIIPALDREGNREVEQNYIDYIEGGGADAVILPHPADAVTDEVLDGCDGFFFLGGADIDPARYGEEAHPALGETIPARDEYEFAVFPRIFDTGKPIFAICRGMQLVNCALGGRLYQDLASERPTDISHRVGRVKYGNFHTAAFVAGTYLHGVLGGEHFTVNSYHHQAVRALGKGLDTMAFAPDGTVEAIYHTGERILWGFQWHPERMDTPVSMRICESFISACGDAGKRREVSVKIDRPLGSRHPKHPDVIYGVNYGYIPGVIGGDGEEQDAYVIGVSEPLREFTGELVAIIHRENDNETKWVVAPAGSNPSPEQIRAAVDFQEKFFDTYIEVIR